MSDQETYAQVRREAIEGGPGREMWDTAMRWHTEMVLDDLRELANERDRKGTAYYQLEWFTDLLDAYEKERLDA